jgi:translocator protein
MKLNIVKLIASIGICLLAGAIGSIFTSKSVSTWYSTINRPSFNPPNWLFGPVWTILFILMGIALYFVWTLGDKQAMIVFAVQLLLNILWSALFFGLKAPFYAFLEIIILWAAILMTIFVFYRVSPKAAYLLVPYILWVSFAAILNFSIWRLN